MPVERKKELAVVTLPPTNPVSKHFHGWHRITRCCPALLILEFPPPGSRSGEADSRQMLGEERHDLRHPAVFSGSVIIRYKRMPKKIELAGTKVRLRRYLSVNIPSRMIQPDDIPYKIHSFGHAANIGSTCWECMEQTERNPWQLEEAERQDLCAKGDYI